MKGRWLIHPEGEGLWNMAVDAVLARGGGAPLTLRCYSWRPATLSLGHSQAWTPEMARRAREAGIPAVRRETGGRAVLHDEELTYCVAIPAHSPLHCGNLPQAYQRINAALATGLAGLGLELSQEARRVDIAAAYRRETGGLCFAATAQSEVLWQNRKLVGSAQRQLREGLLQHGSVIIGPGHLRIGALFFDEPRLREAAAGKLARETTCLAEALGRPPAFPEVAAALREGFAEVFGLDLEDRALDAGEMEGAARWREAFRPEHEAMRLP
jgi:lipoate-protein ligase A